MINVSVRERCARPELLVLLLLLLIMLMISTVRERGCHTCCGHRHRLAMVVVQLLSGSSRRKLKLLVT